MSILVTGGCGFIGSHFIEHIFDSNASLQIINIDAIYYCANPTNIPERIRNNKRYTFIQGNICSMDLLRHVFKMNDIKYVVHFAAQSHVQTSFRDALQYTQDNIVGTHTLLECCRLYAPNLVKLIHISTDEVYGESSLQDVHKKNEQSLLCPTNPYAATKAAAEMLVQSYYHSFQLPIIITRGNNVFGPRQYNEKVIPRFIDLLKNDKKITIQGDGSCVRAFMHVTDVVRAVERILNFGTIGEIYNIGCDEGMEISIMDLSKLIISLVKPDEDANEWITFIADRPFNDKRYYISNQKLVSLGWKITKTLRDGLEELIDIDK